MTLSKILSEVPVTKMYQTLYGKMVVTHETEVKNIQYDSRKVERGDMFVAIRGTDVDGNTFIQQAVSNGAKVVLTDNDSAMDDFFFMHNGVVKVVVSDTRKALAKISSNYYGNPASKLQMVGVTGTNGKTTTALLIKALLDTKAKAGLIGTIEYQIGDERVPASHTTPESLELNQLFSAMVSAGCTAAVMEVSSHALHQHRVDGIKYSSAVFTNLTQDHLDYHKTMEEYFAAKKILFDSLPQDSTAVINIDDEWGKALYKATLSNKLSYGISDSADIQAKNISLSFAGTQFMLHHNGREFPFSGKLVGRFNVSNMLAAYSAGYSLGFAPEQIIRRLAEVNPVAGRFEQIQSPEGWTAIIDYAHTPDALEKALKAIHDVLGEQKQGRIITVFGCGGNRDTKKRPLMASIASTLSDVVVVTSDNPRFENPEMIIDDVMKGIEQGKETVRESDRLIAITNALKMAKQHDVVLIAGKGHEDYQIIQGKKYPFSDTGIVREYIGKNG